MVEYGWIMSQRHISSKKIIILDVQIPGFTLW